MKADNDNRRSALPAGVPPRGLSREAAAQYVGVSPSKWDAMVGAGEMPQPKLIGSRTIWDIRKVDLAFDELPERGIKNDWDDAGDCFGEVSTSRRNRRAGVQARS